MALGKAVLIGVVASIALPYVLRARSGQIGDWAGRGLLQFDVAGHHVSWSLPLFAGITLFAWLIFTWANK